MSDIEFNAQADQAAAHMLQTAIELLRRQIVPQLPDETTRIHADHLTHMLRWLDAHLFKRAGELQRMNAGFAANPPVPLPEGFISLPPEQGRAELESAFEAGLPKLLDRIDAGDRTALAALENMVAGEKSFYLAQDSYISEGAAAAYRLGRIISEAPPPSPKYPMPDEANLTAYVRSRYGRQDVRATDVKIIPGGFSKVTVFLTVEDPRAEPLQLVLRMDMPFNYLNHTVRNEFPVIQRVFAAGLPVPEPLWLETDLAHFGVAFIAFARVSGTSAPTQWTADRAQARIACEALAAALGKLHSFKPSELSYPPEADHFSAGECLERDIGTWAARFRQLRRETLPLLSLTFTWLLRSIPAELYRRPAVVAHGDLGFHNVMVDNGRVTAMLDWEFSKLSDPTQDLRFLRQFVEPLLPWPEFMAIYLANGGSEPCPDTDFFFDLWQHARNTVGCVESRELFDSGASDEVKFALPGHIFGQYLFLDQAETLLTHLRAKLGKPD